MVNNRTLLRAQEQGAISYTILINGEVLPTLIGIYGMQVCKEVNRIPKATISFIDGAVAVQDFELSNKDWFVPGNEISIFLGYLNSEKEIFRGIIISHSISIRQDSSLLDIECRDRTYLMTLNRQGKYFEKLTDSELAKKLLKKYEIDSEIDTSTHQHSKIVQYDCTDWDMLLIRSECNGFLVIADGKKVHIKAPDFNQTPALDLVYGDSVIEFDGKIEARDQFEKVVLKSWNPAKQKVVSHTAKEPDILESGNLVGLQLAKTQLETETIYRHSGVLKDSESQAWANARMLKDRLSRTCGRVQFEGYNAINPGQIVLLEGFGSRFNGLVYVCAVRQEYMEQGWLTEIEFGLSPKWFAELAKLEAPPAAAMLASVSGLQIGIVTQIEDDPDKGHRIRVRLPVIDAKDSGVWARLSSLDAGKNRGAFFLPEVLDEVVVGFVNDDPRQAIVLGMLHSQAKTAPFEAMKKNEEKGFVSRSGIRLVFQEKDKSLTLETPAKNKLLISDKEGGILLSDEHGNSIQLNSEGISFNSKKGIFINAGGSMKTKVDGSWETQAKKQVKIKATKMMEIKGKTVNIN